MKALYRDLKIPQSLKELKIPKESIPTMSKEIVHFARLMENNPRVMTVQDWEGIYEKAF